MYNCNKFLSDYYELWQFPRQSVTSPPLVDIKDLHFNCIKTEIFFGQIKSNIDYHGIDAKIGQLADSHTESSVDSSGNLAQISMWL